MFFVPLLPKPQLVDVASAGVHELVLSATVAQRGSVALATDEHDFGRDECHFFKLDGFALPMHKTGQQKKASSSLAKGADLCESYASIRCQPGYFWRSEMT